jgi:creatinine amidohydrolase
VGLSDLTWTEVADSRRHLVIPVGSYEQHGPHLPLDTDSVIAVAVAEAVVSGRDDLVLAPVVAYSASGEHAGFPGTLSIGTETTTRVLIELVRSADAFASVIVVNGHGGNADALATVRSTARAEDRRVLIWSPKSAGDAHAGESETSLLLHLAPQRVRTGRLEAGRPEPIGELADELRRNGVAAVSANGILGDATTASAHTGAALFAGFVDDLRAAVDDWVRP